MEICAWCGKEVEGEVSKKPAYHTNCKGVFNVYVGAVEKLITICSKVREHAHSIRTAVMEPHDALRNLASELEKAEMQSKQCSELFATRK